MTLSSIPRFTVGHILDNDNMDEAVVCPDVDAFDAPGALRIWQRAIQGTILSRQSAIPALAAMATAETNAFLIALHEVTAIPSRELQAAVNMMADIALGPAKSYSSLSAWTAANHALAQAKRVPVLACTNVEGA